MISFITSNTLFSAAGNTLCLKHYWNKWMCSRIWLLSVIKTEDDVSQKSTNENASCYLLTKYLNFLASNIICDCLMTYIFVEVNLYLIRMSKLCYCHIHKIPYINLRYLIHTLSIPTLSIPYPYLIHTPKHHTFSIPYPYLIHTSKLI